MRHLIELCAGTGAVSLAALGCSRFPVSRIGSKAGWVGPILDALCVQSPIPTATMVEADPRLASLLRTLLTATGRDALASSIEVSLAEPSRVVWERAKGGEEPVDTLLWMAGARGGIGGYKGAHKLRPSVDGFIPARASLARRLRGFNAVGLASVICADASSLDPSAFAASAVFIDPPYVGRQGYRFALIEPVEALAARWSAAGHRVVVSEARPLAGASASHEITTLRRGQSRRSLTTNPTEWLSIYAPSRRVAGAVNAPIVREAAPRCRCRGVRSVSRHASGPTASACCARPSRRTSVGATRCAADARRAATARAAASAGATTRSPTVADVSSALWADDEYGVAYAETLWLDAPEVALVQRVAQQRASRELAAFASAYRNDAFIPDTTCPVIPRRRRR